MKQKLSKNYRDCSMFKGNHKYSTVIFEIWSKLSIKAPYHCALYYSEYIQS